MGKLEQMGESLPKMETKTPPEVLEMDRDLIGEARMILSPRTNSISIRLFCFSGSPMDSVI